MTVILRPNSENPVGTLCPSASDGASPVASRRTAHERLHDRRAAATRPVWLTPPFFRGLRMDRIEGQFPPWAGLVYTTLPPITVMSGSILQISSAGVVM
jgi:hypothetical protein